MAITTVSKSINPSPPMNFILDYPLAATWKKIKQEVGRPFSLSTTLRQWGAYQYQTCSSKAALKPLKNELSEGQIRRQLAQKLGTTANGDLDVETQRKVASFLNSRGQTLFTQSWTPAIDKNMKGLVVLLHGLNEHSGWYASFAKDLNKQGYGVFGMDWIGHGGSDGLHGYVESLDHVLADIKVYIQRVTADHPDVPCFLFGHSTGGAIALKAASQPGMEKVFQGLVVTSPAVRVEPAHPIIPVLAPLLSVLAPRFQFRGACKASAVVCRDPAALIDKYTDPLVYTGDIRVRTGSEILRLSGYLMKNLKMVNTPFFVLHGTDDQITDPNGSQELYKQASSQHKALNLYEGLLHDLLFEPEKEAITNDIVQWMDQRLA